MPRSSSVLLSSLKLSSLALSILVFSTLSFAAAPDRISGPIIAQQLIKLSAGVPMRAQPQYDQGPVDPSFKLSYMTLLTVPSASQQRAIDQLLAQQQDPRSPLYHKWLTPEQYADRFGLSPNDIQKITTWLQSQGFSISSVARGRNWVTFSGTAAQAESAFQTQIHNFDVAGEKHFSNITPPSIPAALSGVVTGIRGLNDFRPKSHAIRSKPNYTLPVTGGDLFFIAPGDITTIYDVNLLYTAGFDGTGQKLAVMGQTDVYLADLNDFRSGFGLPTIPTSGAGACTTNSSNVITACASGGNFSYVVVGTDAGAPNSQGDDLPEADIDLEWSNAVAQKAQIVYVTAPLTAFGTWDAWYYAVDNNVAPVITLSYGLCELGEASNGASGKLTFPSDEAELKKANTQGITFLNSSGDSGAAECDFPTNFPVNGIAVSYPASSPEVTGVGGTLIPYPDYTSAFWNTTTNGTTGGSALSYIPEEAWNDEQEWSEFCTAVPSNPTCTAHPGLNSWVTAQETYIGVFAGGGGLSNCVTETGGVCATPPNGGFPQPTWQAGLAIPGQATKVRYSPDVSLLASAFWPGYIICTAANEIGGTGTASSCASGIPGTLAGCTGGAGLCSVFGGTSISSPVFAGIVTLMNQYLGSSGGLGNINPKLYSLAATPANLAFHPVEVGSIGAFCPSGSPSNQPVALQCPAAVPPATQGFLGFDASAFDPTTGYNLATGLGSVDANNLAIAWKASLLAATTTTLTSSPNPAFSGVSVTFTATVTSTGANAPTGTVTFNDGTTALGTGTLNGSQVATFATSTLTVGTHSITAVYGGDANNAGSTSSVLSQVIKATTFTFVSTPGTATSHTVLSGQTTLNYSFLATPTSGSTFVNAVNLSCTTFSPADPTLTNSSCTFTPSATIAAGSPASTVTMTISTKGPNSGTGTLFRHRSDNRLPWLPLTLPLAGVVMIGLAGRKMSRAATVVGMCLMLALAGFLIACGSSSPPVSITSVTGSSSSIYPQNAGWTNATATFTAVLANDSGNKGVTWAVSAPGSGNPGMIATTDPTHATYTPPTIAAGLTSPITVTATSVADTSKTGTASIALNSTTLPGTYTVTVTAAEAGATSQTANVTLVDK